MTKASKFSAVFDNRKADDLVEPEIELALEVEPVEVISPKPLVVTTEVSTTQPPTKKMGRPGGKRSDPDYTQVTAYIRGNVHRDVKVALLLEDKGQEFSELINDLLTDWLRLQSDR